MLTCANCGHEEPEGARFCGSCGTPFAPADPQPSHAAASGGAMLTCTNCGNEEPEGSRFCGNCSAPFVIVEEPAELEPAEHELAHTASMEAALYPRRRPRSSLLRSSPRRPRKPRPAPPPKRKRRLLWFAAGAAGLLLVAGGATTVVLLLAGGEDSTEVMTGEQQPPPGTTSESVPPPSNPTLADSIGPRLDELAASQAALSTRVSSLSAGVESFAALRGAAESLAASVVRTQQFADTLAPNDSTDAATLVLLRGALAAHLAYAETIAGLPSRPRAFTETSAQTVIAQAELVRRAYTNLAVADATLPVIYISRSDHAALLAVVPSPTPAPTAAGRVVDLVPLLVGMGPDDPLGQGRCFGPYTSRASLRVSGVVHRSGFIQCGDDANGDPSRASGVYAFSGPTYPGQSRLVRLTAQAAIDESSSSSQRGSSVTWTVLYDGRPMCSTTVVWSGPRPLPRRLDCKIPAAASSGGLDVGRLRIQQVASLASSGRLWAGLLDPRIVVDPL